MYPVKEKNTNERTDRKRIYAPTVAIVTQQKNKGVPFFDIVIFDSVFLSVEPVCVCACNANVGYHSWLRARVTHESTSIRSSSSTSSGSATERKFWHINLLHAVLYCVCTFILNRHWKHCLEYETFFPLYIACFFIVCGCSFRHRVIFSLSFERLCVLENQ